MFGWFSVLPLPPVQRPHCYNANRRDREKPGPGEIAHVAAHIDHECGEGQDADARGPGERPPAYFGKPGRIINQVKGNHRNKPADQQRCRALVFRPLVEKLFLPFGQCPFYKRLAEKARETKRQKRAYHRTGPGQERAIESAVHTAGGDRHKFSREGDEAMDNHQTDNAKLPPHAHGFNLRRNGVIGIDPLRAAN